MSGSQSHSDFCKYNLEETERKFDRMKDLLREYRDRCPCTAASKCDLCREVGELT